MGAAREADQADFDLERFINMFDEAITSKDPRVIETLRSLMMIVTLTRPETGSVEHDRQRGPLRRMFDDMHSLNRRMYDIEEGFRSIQRERERNWSKDVYLTDDYNKYTMTAASQMARHMDDSLLQELSKNTATAINGGKWPLGKLK